MAATDKLPPYPCDCGDVPHDSECRSLIDRVEEARRIARECFAVVKNLWIEPFATVKQTSDGRRHVMAWIQVDES